MDKIIKVVPNDEPPTKYNYKHFDVVFENGSTDTFHYHINNPMPTEEQMIGLTWDELSAMCLKMFYDKIKLK